MTIILLVIFFLVWQPKTSQAADTTDTKTDLSSVNGDTEEEDTGTAEKANPDFKSGDDLSTISWEDEDADPEEEAENKAADKKREEEYRVIEKQERTIQIAGFFTFCVYLFGMFLTAYFTRNRKLSVNYPPELLILLHALWPLQWLLLPFAGQKVR